MSGSIGPFGEYVIYVDESGDHNLEQRDPVFFIFVLAFCIFDKEEYIRSIVPEFQNLKFTYFDHDMVVFHEREIRKSQSLFDILFDQTVRERFFSDLNSFIQGARFQVAASVIDKREFRRGENNRDNPYLFALRNNLGLANRIIGSDRQFGVRMPIVCESRGKKEDDYLEESFNRICQCDKTARYCSFYIVMADKKVNSTGLQIADLLARPLGRYYLDGGESSSRAIQILKQKFRVLSEKSETPGVTTLILT